MRRVSDRAAAADLRSAGIGSRPELVQKEIEQLAAAQTLSARRHDLLVAWANTQNDPVVAVKQARVRAALGFKSVSQ